MAGVRRRATTKIGFQRFQRFQRFNHRFTQRLSTHPTLPTNSSNASNLAPLGAPQRPKTNKKQWFFNVFALSVLTHPMRFWSHLGPSWRAQGAILAPFGPLWVLSGLPERPYGTSRKRLDLFRTHFLAILWLQVSSASNLKKYEKPLVCKRFGLPRPTAAGHTFQLIANTLRLFGPG